MMRVSLLVSSSVNVLRLYLNLVSNAGNVDVGVLVATRGGRRDAKFGSIPTSLWVVIFPLSTMLTRDHSSAGRPYILQLM
jgi:hypothetical protein